MRASGTRENGRQAVADHDEARVRQPVRESRRRGWTSTAAALVAGALAAACAAAQAEAAPPTTGQAPAEAMRLLDLATPTRGVPTRATPTKGEASGPAKGDKAVDFDLYALPEDFKYPSGAFNQDAIVAQQKKRVDLMNKAMSARFRLTETLHYLIFSDAEASVASQFQTWSEALYNHLFIQLGFPPSQHIWDGKCVLILTAGRPTFLEYARKFDHHDASTAGAYFAIEGWPEGLPQLVHLAIPVDTRDTKRLQELFAHEGTHAFFELYRKPGRLPLWLHEGLAEYMTIVNDRTLKPMKWAPAVKIAQKGTPIENLFKATVGDPLTLDDYSVAVTMVDYLMASSRMRLKSFIDNLKDGKDQEAALKAAYGLGLSDLERRWRPYVVADGGTKPAPADPRPMSP